MAEGKTEGQQPVVSRRTFLKATAAAAVGLGLEASVGKVDVLAQTGTPTSTLTPDANVQKIASLQTAIVNQEKQNTEKAAATATVQAQQTAVAELEKKATALAEPPTKTPTKTETPSPTSTGTATATPNSQQTKEAIDRAVTEELTQRRQAATAQAAPSVTADAQRAGTVTALQTAVDEAKKTPPTKEDGGIPGIIWGALAAAAGILGANNRLRTGIWNSRPMRWITRR